MAASWATGCATRSALACAEETMPETPNPEAVTLFALVVNRYSSRLTTEQLDEIKKMIEGQVEMARALRALRLTNADGPFPHFAAYRNDTTPDRSALASPLENERLGSKGALSPEGRGM
jgi:hypothetical protein